MRGAGRGRWVAGAATLLAMTALATPAVGAVGGAGLDTDPSASALVLHRAALPPPVRLGDQVLSATATITTRSATAGTDPALGVNVSAVVVEPWSGTTLWSRNADVARMPASNDKLLTAYVALRSIPSGTRFPTRAVLSATNPSVVHLVGGGDPTLTTARLDQVAAATAAALKARGRTLVALRVDDSLFPAPTIATGWKTTYLPYDVAPVRALVVDSHDVWDTGLDAGAVFAKRLAAHGVDVVTVARAAAPARSAVLATTWSAPVATVVQDMVNESQNDYAEALYRLAALARGQAPSWVGANANAAAVLTADGIPLTGWVMADGSGLSRSDRVAPLTLLAVLDRVRTTPALSATLLPSNGLPTAGQTGTLETRFTAYPTLCAKGWIHAKTGTLADAVALSGFAVGTDGRTRLFSIIVNGVTSVATTRAAVDRLAATFVGCA